MKLGTWVYFYENGTVNKIENYSFPYHDFATDNLEFGFTYSSLPIISGLFTEYFESGKIKIDGNWKYYNEDGSKIKVKKYNLKNWKNEKIRPIITTQVNEIINNRKKIRRVLDLNK